MLIHGDRSYFYAGRQAALSVLHRSNFHLFLARGVEGALNVGQKSRVKHYIIQAENAFEYRARPFLLKFKALKACIENTVQPWIILLDADAVMVRRLSTRTVEHSLPKSGLGMVEQKTVCGSEMSRFDFHEHYIRHSLAWLAPNAKAPAFSKFRYYNSGVVLGHRNEFQKFIAWAMRQLEQSPGDHRVGEHMIGDQDYFQFWTNNLHLENRNTLPWFWNHCEHWDEGFPRKGAYILHFSNFCQKPSYEQVLRMVLARHGVGSLERVFLPLAEKVFRLCHV
jgi:hypothetical protein